MACASSGLAQGTVMPVSAAPFPEVTQAMIEAGLAELFDHRFGEDVREVITAIYYAMDLARDQGAKETLSP